MLISVPLSMPVGGVEFDGESRGRRRKAEPEGESVGGGMRSVGCNRLIDVNRRSETFERDGKGR